MSTSTLNRDYNNLVDFQHRERQRDAAAKRVADEQRRQLHAAVYAQRFAQLSAWPTRASFDNADHFARRDADAAVARAER